MSIKGQQLLEEALCLEPAERAAVIEALLASLDQPDPELDALWAKEAEDRIAAFDSGKMEATPAETLLRELRR